MESETITNPNTQTKEVYIAPTATVEDVKLDQSFLQLTASAEASGFGEGGSF